MILYWLSTRPVWWSGHSATSTFLPMVALTSHYQRIVSYHYESARSHGFAKDKESSQDKRPVPLDITPDELLTTTRAVRRRLDLTRPVERELIEECIGIAQQAPSGSNMQPWHFVVVTDPAKRAGLANLYRKGGESYFSQDSAPAGDPKRQAERIRLERVCPIPGRTYSGGTRARDPLSQRPHGRAVRTGPGCDVGLDNPCYLELHARPESAGPRSAYTTFHLSSEEEAAKLLGIPFERVTQAALIPVAYTRGTSFKPGHASPSLA